MPLLTSIRYGLEFAAVRAALALADATPPAATPGLAALFGSLVYYGNARRRAVAVDNILKAGLASDPAQAARIARASFRHFALLTLESIKAQRFLTPATLPAHMALDVHPATDALLRDPSKGVLAACGHFGNWEILARAVSFTKPVVAIAQPLKNPLVDRLMIRRSPDSRFRTIPKHDDDMMRLVGCLKEGSVLAVMIDQYAIKKPILVDFLGRPACHHRGIALLHLVTRAPIVYGACRRTGPLQFAATLSEPLAYKPSGDKEEDVRAIIRDLDGRLERDIRAAPGQYMWGHRRWRLPK